MHVILQFVVSRLEEEHVSEVNLGYMVSSVSPGVTTVWVSQEITKQKNLNF